MKKIKNKNIYIKKIQRSKEKKFYAKPSPQCHDARKEVETFDAAAVFIDVF